MYYKRNPINNNILVTMSQLYVHDLIVFLWKLVLMSYDFQTLIWILNNISVLSTWTVERCTVSAYKELYDINGVDVKQD